MSRFTERSQRVILIAQEEARRLRHSCVEPLHILSAIVALGEGVACQILFQDASSRRGLRDEIEKTFVPGDQAQPIGEIPFTPQAKRVLEHAVEEAQEMGHGFIGTEYLLLGLFRSETAARILQERGFKVESIRGEVIRILGKVPGPPHSRWVNPVNLGQQLMVLALAPDVAGVLVTNKSGAGHAPEVRIVVLLETGTEPEAARKALAPILPGLKGLRFKCPGRKPVSWSDGAWKEDVEFDAALTF